MRNLLLAAVVLLSACSPTLEAASDAGGIIGSASAGRSKAFALAQEHCQKRGKSARVSGGSDWSDTLTFDCV